MSGDTGKLDNTRKELWAKVFRDNLDKSVEELGEILEKLQPEGVEREAIEELIKRKKALQNP